MAPRITRIETIEFGYSIENLGYTPGGFDPMYAPGETAERRLFGIRVHTDEGIAGEYVGGNSPAMAQVNMYADYLVGRNPLKRERHWSEVKRALRKYDRMGIGPIDIALWDFAGKYRDAPIHELLGTYRDRLPAYASTMHGQNEGGLDSAEAYADFAEECLDLGYPAFKIHGFDEAEDEGLHERDIRAVRALGERVGDDMDLMLDSSCKYETWGQALAVGEACDEAGFFWYEDPYSDGGASQHGHRTLRQRLDTPLLQAEMVRGVEPHTDFVAAEATDFVRVDPEYDGGITGAMKIARAAEGFGLDVEPHGPGPARRHCMAATRNANYYENALVHPICHNPADNPAYVGGYSDALDAVDPDGTFPVPSDPGLGVEIDWDYVEERETRRLVFE